MKVCAHCGGDFAPRKRAITCSPECSAAHRTKRERKYAQDSAVIRRIRAKQQRTREVIYRVRPTKRDRLDRAVKILFQLTGEPS